jgi:hypothetical protein
VRKRSVPSRWTTTQPPRHFGRRSLIEALRKDAEDGGKVNDRFVQSVQVYRSSFSGRLVDRLTYVPTIKTNQIDLSETPFSGTHVVENMCLAYAACSQEDEASALIKKVGHGKRLLVMGKPWSALRW